MGESDDNGNGGCEFGDSGVCDGGSSLETAFELLAPPRRRLALHRLSDEEVAAVDDLVEFVHDHALEEDLDAEAVELELYHQHLPALEDVGVVEFDERSETVRYHADETVEELLDFAEHYDFA